MNVLTDEYVDILSTALAIQPRESDVMVGDTVSIKCMGLGTSLHDPAIYWYKLPGKRIHSDQQGQLVVNATNVQQSGIYVCCIFIQDKGRCSPQSKINVYGELGHIITCNNIKRFECYIMLNMSNGYVWKY